MNPLTDRREFLRQTSAAPWRASAARTVGGRQGRRCNRRAALRAGTAQVEITPQKFPVLVCGGFLSRSARRSRTRCWRACLVLDDGARRLLIMVADTIEIPYDMQEASESCRRQGDRHPTDHMLISATHTHSGGSLFSALGTRPIRPTVSSCRAS